MTPRDDDFDPHVLAAGALSAASRFIPLPFVDDIIKRRSDKHVVGRAIDRAGFSYPVDDLAPLYTELSGGGRSLAKKLVTKVALYPVRRVARVVTAVDGVPRDALRPALLARAIERAMSRGMLSGKVTPEQRGAEAEMVRDAFEEAFEGISRRLREAAWSDVRRAATEGDPSQLGDDLGQLLERFDARFDRALA